MKPWFSSGFLCLAASVVSCYRCILLFPHGGSKVPCLPTHPTATPMPSFSCFFMSMELRLLGCVPPMIIIPRRGNLINPGLVQVSSLDLVHSGQVSVIASLGPGPKEQQWR